jgi:AraC-like DNA-binding protein
MASSLACGADRAVERTRVLCAAPGETPWELWQRTPTPQLVGLVAGLWAGDSGTPFARHRVLPSGELTLMLHLGPPQRVIERGGTASDELLRAGSVSGLQERPATFEAEHPNTRVVALRLLPLGAWALFGGLPLSELTGRVLEPECVFGGRVGIEPLRQRMIEAPDLGDALDLLERWLVARLYLTPAAHAATRAACELLARTQGELRVARLSREVGVSARRLNELFLRQIGLPAKRYARILRFRHAVQRLSTAPVTDLARLALECGYYDQPHLYRDFRELATLTPGQYLMALGRGLDGPLVVSG